MSDATSSLLPRRWSRFWAIMGLFTILGLVDAAQFYIHVRHFRGNPIHWEEAVAIGLGDWYLWAAFSPLIFRLARRFPFDYANWPRRLLMHVGFGCIVMVLKTALDVSIYMAVLGKDMMFLSLTPDERMLTNYEYLYPLFKNFALSKGGIYLVIYGAIVGASHFYDYYRRYREHELQASRLETQLAQAQLQVLRMQLQPHFLFNTLNAIAALMHKDVRLADRMIARLGELLRATLENPATQEGTLRQELAFLRPYLEIEQARLGPRLAVSIDAPTELLDAKLPYLLIQPLVENAIRHGIAPRVGPGRLAIRARRDDDSLVIEVIDNGIGFRENAQSRDGIGVSNTRARLRGLYGDRGRLALEPDPLGGVVATVTLPYREDDEPSASDFAEADAGAVPPAAAPADRPREVFDESAGARR